jgi:hypothetical protein
MTDTTPNTIPDPPYVPPVPAPPVPEPVPDPYIAPRDASALRTPATGETATPAEDFEARLTRVLKAGVETDAETEISAVEAEVKNLREAAPVVDTYAVEVLHDIRDLFTKLVGHLGI